LNKQPTNSFQLSLFVAIISFCFLSCSYSSLASAETTPAEQSMLSSEQQDSSAMMPMQQQNMADNNNEQTDMAESSGISPPVEDTSLPETMMPLAEQNDSTMAPTEEQASMPVSDPVRYSSISEIPADYYAVQVVATSSMRNLDAFANKYQLSNNLSTQIVVHGRTWNILLSGAYPTRDEAKAAVAEFAGRLSTSPWVRRVSTLQ